MITLYYSPASPYARKCRIVLREKKLTGQVTETIAQPLDEPHFVRGINPLGKVPALVTERGMLIADSPVICAYLDRLGTAPPLTPSGDGEWLSHTQHALADGVMDAALTLRMESLRPAQFHYPPNRDRQTDAIDRTLDFFEREHADWSAFFGLGCIALGAALGYLDLRFENWGWRAKRPKLAAWWEETRARPSFKATEL